MNQDIVDKKWDEFKGKVKARWGKLTDDDLEAVRGSTDEMAGRLQKAYGYSREQAEQEYEDFRAGLDEELTENAEPDVDMIVNVDADADVDFEREDKVPRKSA